MAEDFGGHVPVAPSLSRQLVPARMQEPHLVRKSAVQHPEWHPSRLEYPLSGGATSAVALHGKQSAVTGRLEGSPAAAP